MNRKIFISYKRAVDGAPEQDSELLAQKLRVQLDQAAYTVLLDKDIRAGARWRDVIHQNLQECEAAVVLMSPAAFTSEWVRIELSVLSSRARARNTPIELLIAAVGEAKLAALDDAPLAALHLREFQVYGRSAAGVDPARSEYRDEDHLLQILVRELALRLPTQRPTPRGRLVAKLRGKLSKFPSALEDLEQLLKIAQPPPDLDGRFTEVANALLSASRLQLTEATQQLRVNGGGSKSDIAEIVELAYPFSWVNAEAAARLAHVHATSAFPGWNARRGWSFVQYLRRAEEFPGFWHALQTGLPGSELPCASLEEVAAEMCHRLCGPEEQAEIEKLASAEEKLRRIAEGDDGAGLDVFYPVVSRLEDAEYLLGLATAWIRPILATADAPPPGKPWIQVSPLGDQEESEARRKHDRILRTIEQ
jgi:hypothetical protein